MISLCCLLTAALMTLVSPVVPLGANSSPEGRANRTEEQANRLPRHSHMGSFTQPIRQPGPALKGIPVESLAPQCPPPPVTRSLGICYLKTCTIHQQCPQGHACCFNGCIRTCLEPLQQPAAFDWIEDTSQILRIFGSDFDDYPTIKFVPILVPQSKTSYGAIEAEEELVYMPGGCLVSASQHKKLKQFAESPSIKQCRCQDGEVVCDVTSEKI